jgi:hypothetical protein
MNCRFIELRVNAALVVRVEDRSRQERAAQLVEPPDLADVGGDRVIARGQHLLVYLRRVRLLGAAVRNSQLVEDRGQLRRAPHLGHDSRVAPHLRLERDLPLGELEQEALGTVEVDADSTPAHGDQHGDKRALHLEQRPQAELFEQRPLSLENLDRQDHVVDGVGRDDLRRRAPDVVARVALAEVLDQPMIHRRVGLGNFQVVLGERVEAVRESCPVDQRLCVLNVPERPGDIDAGGVQES